MAAGHLSCHLLPCRPAATARPGCSGCRAGRPGGGSRSGNGGLGGGDARRRFLAGGGGTRLVGVAWWEGMGGQEIFLYTQRHNGHMYWWVPPVRALTLLSSNGIWMEWHTCQKEFVRWHRRPTQFFSGIHGMTNFLNGIHVKDFYKILSTFLLFVLFRKRKSIEKNIAGSGLCSCWNLENNCLFCERSSSNLICLKCLP